MDRPCQSQPLLVPATAEPRAPLAHAGRQPVGQGITGLWQVSGRSDTSWDDNVMMDLYYVENWSLSFDVIILPRTFKAVFTGSGAY